MVSVPAPATTVEVRQQLVAGQPTHGARLVLEFHVEQVGHDVVRRILDAPVDVLSNSSPVAKPLSASIGLPASVRIVALVLFTDHHLVVLGDSEQQPITRIGIMRAEVGDEVESAGAHQWVQSRAQ